MMLLTVSHDLEHLFDDAARDSLAMEALPAIILKTIGLLMGEAPPRCEIYN